ncbi:MAG: hypothetical protein R6V62_08720 [Candidatus Fermentibacteraceae bacterium]
MKRALILVMLLAALVSAKSIVLTLDAPDTNISGLAWGNDALWALDATTRFVHQVNPATGAIISTFYFNYTESMTPTGLAYSETLNRVIPAGWLGTNGYVYQYTPDGTFITKTSMCGG